MSNTVQIFNSEQFGTIRTAGTTENPLFCLVDVCKALNLTPSKVAQRLDNSVLSKYPAQTGFGTKELNFVNEDGLYDVILDSRKPEAKAFRKWVTSEILPAIRKTGGYMVAAPEETPEQIMARALRVADDTLRRQQAQLEAANGTIAEQRDLIAIQNEVIDQKSAQLRRLVPFADYARNAIESNTATYTMTDTAAFLGFVRVSDFMDWTMQQGILRRLNGRWMPTAEYLGQGYFSTRVFRKVISSDYFEEVPYTVVTEAGRKMLFDRMTNYTEPTYALAEPVTLIEEGGAL